MNLLRRNKRPFSYKNYLATEEILDEGGYFTGQRRVTYTEPVTVWGNISSNTGAAVYELFGTSLNYNKVIVCDFIEGLDENTIIVIDGKDYRVERYAPSFNHLTIAVSRLD